MELSEIRVAQPFPYRKVSEKAKISASLKKTTVLPSLVVEAMALDKARVKVVTGAPRRVMGPVAAAEAEDTTINRTNMKVK